MPRVMIKCPVTGKAVDTAFFMDVQSFNSCDFSNNSFQCSECGRMHTWDKKDAFLEGESPKAPQPARPR